MFDVALRAVALLLFLCAGPWFVWAVFEAAELQAEIDARVMHVTEDNR